MIFKYIRLILFHKNGLMHDLV